MTSSQVLKHSAKKKEINTSQISVSTQSCTKDSISCCLDDSVYYSVCSEHDQESQNLSSQDLSEVETSQVTLKKLRSKSWDGTPNLALRGALPFKVIPLRKHSDGPAVCHQTPELEIRNIEMVNMRTRISSSKRCNQIQKIRSQRREENMKKFERADLPH